MNGNGKQIVLCATRYQETWDWLVTRTGKVYQSGGGLIVALENECQCVPVGGRWLRASLSPLTNRYAPDGSGIEIRVPDEYCTKKPYRGCQYWEMISERQLTALRRLLLQLLDAHAIRPVFDNRLGDLCPLALNGTPGIFFASSFDRRRVDLPPQQALYNLIKNLSI